jgi:hypothetical protein
MTSEEYFLVTRKIMEEMGLNQYAWQTNEEAIMAKLPIEALEYILDHDAPNTLTDKHAIWDTTWVEKCQVEYTERLLLK